MTWERAYRFARNMAEQTGHRYQVIGVRIEDRWGSRWIYTIVVA